MSEKWSPWLKLFIAIFLIRIIAGPMVAASFIITFLIVAIFIRLRNRG